MHSLIETHTMIVCDKAEKSNLYFNFCFVLKFGKN